MLNNTKNNNSISWIGEAISKRHLKYYEYDHFSNVQVIDSGGYGKIYRANWKNSDQHFALKEFIKLDNAAVKEIVYEVIYCVLISYFIFFLIVLNFNYN
jgi:hypothetical protein